MILNWLDNDISLLKRFFFYSGGEYCQKGTLEPALSLAVLIIHPELLRFLQFSLVKMCRWECGLTADKSLISKMLCWPELRCIK